MAVFFIIEHSSQKYAIVSKLILCNINLHLQTIYSHF